MVGLSKKKYHWVAHLGNSNKPSLLTGHLGSLGEVSGQFTSGPSPHIERAPSLGSPSTKVESKLVASEPASPQFYQNLPRDASTLAAFVHQPPSPNPPATAVPAKRHEAIAISEADFPRSFPQDDAIAATSIWSSVSPGHPHPDIHSLAGTTASSPSRRYDACSQTSICFGAEAMQHRGASLGPCEELAEIPSLEHPTLDEQLKEMCALIQARLCGWVLATASSTRNIHLSDGAKS